MRVNFCLKQWLLDHGETEHGLINRVADGANLKRHQVSALLKNRVKHLPLDSLGAICQYLIDTHRVPRTQLPDILFALQPEDFWELLCGRPFVEICFGVRPHGELPATVVGADSYLHGELLARLFEAKPEYANPDEEQSLIQQMIPAFGGSASEDEAIEEANKLYSKFEKQAGRCGLAMLGSVKSNPATEIFISRTFDAQPFISQDDVATPRDRSCPFYLAYRPFDIKPHSCHGGIQLAQSIDETVPGIHFEQADGEWGVVEWTPTQDAALVMYVHRPNTEVVEMTMGGFSSRSTHSLATVLPRRATDLWPPAFDAPDFKIGVFIVQFRYAEPTNGNAGADALRTAKPIDVNVIPLSQEAIQRRIEPVPAESE